jgi:DNA repair protein RadD
MKLREYQEKIKSDVYSAWQEGFKNVLLVLPTGMGKTFTFCSITNDLAILNSIEAVKDIYNYPTAMIVHRKELVQQICLSLSQIGIQHNIIATKNVVRGIIAAERKVHNKTFYNNNANVTVISVDTLNSRILKYETWAKTIKFWITDEAAHLLKQNKWGRAVSYFPNAVGLGVTATPERLDRKGLGSHVDGVFDTLVEGPNTAWGIDNNFLSKYKIAIPDSDYKQFLKSASEGADYTKQAMAEASKKSQIIGDVVKNYQKFAAGKQAIVFATDIDTGQKMETQFKEADISTKFLSSKNTDQERLQNLIDYREKKIKVLINVDLFDEGLDVPGIEAVIMARPTMSLGKFLQMIGRGLRIMEGKSHMILIDHVGNVIQHGLPCQKRFWTLDRIVKRKSKINLIRICKNVECCAPFDRTLSECPYCGFKDMPRKGIGGSPREALEEVDGDLYLLDPMILRKLEKDIVLEDPGDIRERVTHAAGTGAGIRAQRNQQARIITQEDLSERIAKWAGRLRHQGFTDRMIHKYFYAHFDITITEALSLKRADMIKLMEGIE